MYRLLIVVLALLVLEDSRQIEAQAVQRVSVVVAAPIFLKPEASLVPLRMAKEGSVLNVLESAGDWYCVEFNDPQFGRRIGYIQKKQVKVLPPDYSQIPSVDVTVAKARPTPTTPARTDGIR